MDNFFRFFLKLIIIMGKFIYLKLFNLIIFYLIFPVIFHTLIRISNYFKEIKNSKKKPNSRIPESFPNSKIVPEFQNSDN